MFYLNEDLDTKNRYDPAKFMEYSEFCHDILTSKFINDIPVAASAGYKSVQYNEGKPDKLSYDLYGSTQFWWIILLYNKLLTDIELTSDMTILYPLLSELEESYFRLKSLNTAEQRSVSSDNEFVVQRIVQVETVKIVNMTGSYVAPEVPAGDMDGVNRTFLLTYTPIDGTLTLILNGLVLTEGASADFTISGKTLTMNTIPISTDNFNARYLTLDI